MVAALVFIAQESTTLVEESELPGWVIWATAASVLVAFAVWAVFGVRYVRAKNATAERSAADEAG